METWNCYWSGRNWHVCCYLHSRNFKICRTVWKNPTALVNTPLTFQEPKDYKAVVTLKFNKIPESCQKEASPEYLQSQPKSPTSAAFCSFYGLFKEMWHDLGLWWHKGNTVHGKTPEATTLKVTQKIHILNSKKVLERPKPI